MSRFSEYFTKIKESRGLTNPQISNISGLDKALLFRWAAGKECPASWQQLEVLCRQLQLSLEEELGLQNAYQFTKMGEEAYTCHHKIMEILHVFQQRGAEYHSLQKNQTKAGITLPGFVQMKNKLEIIQWTQKALGNLAVQEEKRLYLKMQAAYPEILMLLKIFFGCTENCTVEEIVYLVSEKQGASLHNLEVLKGIAEIVVQKHPVEVFWQEDSNCERGFSDNWILSDGFIVQFDGLLSKGMLVTEPEWLGFFQCTFQRMKESSQSLGGKKCGLPELFQGYGYKEAIVSSLEYMPCIGPCLTMELLERQIYPEIPGREALIQEIYRNCVSMTGRGKAFFCREGLEEFMETGRIESFPYEVYRKPSMEQRCQMVERMIAITEQGELTYQMVKGEQFPHMKGLYLELIEGEQGRLSIDMHFLEGDKERFLIRDQGIQGYFQVFFQNLEGSGYAYSAQETAAYMREIVNQYRKKALEDRVAHKV